MLSASKSAAFGSKAVKSLDAKILALKVSQTMLMKWTVTNLLFLDSESTGTFKPFVEMNSIFNFQWAMYFTL